MSHTKSIQNRVYKKIWSTDPNQYTYLEAEGVYIRYTDYISACMLAGNDLTEIKSIKEWLETEI